MSVVADSAKAFEAGRQDMLRQVLAEALVFEAKMRKRRYFNNAAGVARFSHHLEATFIDRIEARGYETP